MNLSQHITVLLAEDHMILREGLRKLLKDEHDIKVVGEASNGRQAVDMTKKLHPDVVIMDVAMPKLNGIEATRQICQVAPDVKVIALSGHNDDAFVEAVMELGAAGYLVKQTSADCLSESIREVQKGNVVFSPDIANRYHKRHQISLDRDGLAMAKITRLSSREVEVFQQIAEGKANKQIASELGISIKTVEKHRGNVMQKLDIHDTASLTRHAIEAGIVECSIHSTIMQTCTPVEPMAG